MYDSLGDAFLEKERKIKQEIAVVSLLWLFGCPVLCLLTDTGTLYGTPDEELCGLLSYSVSSSMTGHYPKVLGSIMAPLFAVLVVQRSSNGLCSNLKLGWMARFSPLVNKEKQDEKTSLLALKLWHHICRIELLGYFAGCCLIALVAFDSKDFILAHIFFAIVAFHSLFKQNRLVGRLGEEFPQLFPDWSYRRATLVFYWGMVHLYAHYFGHFFLGTMKYHGRCNDIGTLVDSVSAKAFVNPETLWWLISMAFWFNEYAFAFMCIYVQLLEHYELRVWEFAGATNMPYMGIVSRFSIRAAVEQLLGRASDANIFLGNDTREKAKTY